MNVGHSTTTNTEGLDKRETWFCIQTSSMEQLRSAMWCGVRKISEVEGEGEGEGARVDVAVEGWWCTSWYRESRSLPTSTLHLTLVSSQDQPLIGEKR